MQFFGVFLFFKNYNLQFFTDFITVLEFFGLFADSTLECNFLIVFNS